MWTVLQGLASSIHSTGQWDSKHNTQHCTPLRGQSDRWALHTVTELPAQAYNTVRLLSEPRLKSIQIYALVNNNPFHAPLCNFVGNFLQQCSVSLSLVSHLEPLLSFMLRLFCKKKKKSSMCGILCTCVISPSQWRGEKGIKSK